MYVGSCGLERLLLSTLGFIPKVSLATHGKGDLDTLLHNWDSHIKHMLMNVEMCNHL